MDSAVGPEPGDVRTAEFARSLAAVRTRIAAAAAAAGRGPAAVTLVAVTKFFPAADVLRLAALGVRDVGENREQEATGKVADVAGLSAMADATRVATTPAPPGSPVPVAELRWHMIGQLQTNKARAVARWAATVESVDRVRLVVALSRAATEAGRELDCLIQVDLAGPGADGAARGAGRGGAAPGDVPALGEALAGAAGLRLRGVMAVAPRDTDPRPAFERLAGLAAALRRDHPGADVVSAGMSGDLEAAVAAGATHVRIGSALLGARPAPV